MASIRDNYDVIICGAGSGGGFLAGEVAPYASVLILESGPNTVGGQPSPGTGSTSSRLASTQINLGVYIPDGVSAINRGRYFYAYNSYLDAANPGFSSIQREARLVGGGSHINVGAWIRPVAVDFDGFAAETGVRGWTRDDFAPHFQKAETILRVHRDVRDNWNAASVFYEKTALAMGIPVFETASNRFRCLHCGHRLNAGMPCKYDSLMSTAVTQIPKALASGADLADQTTVLRVEISNRKATGVTFLQNGQSVTVKANKLVVVAGGAVGTPALLFDSGVHLLNDNVGRHLRTHPTVGMDAIIPGQDWHSDRGYQWACFHYAMDGATRRDVIVHPSAGLQASTPWLSAQFGNLGTPYKDVVRAFRQRVGAFLFSLKPGITGRVLGGVGKPIIQYPIIGTDGQVEPKTLDDLVVAIRQVAAVFRQMGAIQTIPNPNEPTDLLRQEIAQGVLVGGVPHPQGTCRAGADPATSVVDSNCLSHDVGNLMICDASVLPNHISANPNAMIMAVASRCSQFVVEQILGKKLAADPPAEAEAVAP